MQTSGLSIAALVTALAAAPALAGSSMDDISVDGDDFEAGRSDEALSSHATQGAGVHANTLKNSVHSGRFRGNDLSMTDVVTVDNNQDGARVIYIHRDDQPSNSALAGMA